MLIASAKEILILYMEDSHRLNRVAQRPIMIIFYHTDYFKTYFASRYFYFLSDHGFIHLPPDFLYGCLIKYYSTIITWCA